MLDALRVILVRDLNGVIAELEAYPDDASVWQLPAGAPNSAGTLALHLEGNLRHFIGAVLGGTGFVRDCEAEFALRDLPRAELAARLSTARGEVESTLRALAPERLNERYPLAVGGMQPPTDAFLIHLAAHLTYHLGQIDYHRRLTTSSHASVGTLGPAALAP
ncbi:MAG: DinB family protein [Gemmatimonadaceae bacterium]|nr:DinB family protein [Gemmatimonadaceae bacterium]